MMQDQGPFVGDGRSRRDRGTRGPRQGAGYSFLEIRAQFSWTCREADGQQLEESRAVAFQMELDPSW